MIALPVRTTAAITALLAAAALPARAEEPVTLRLRLQPGDAYLQSITLRQAQSPVAVNPNAPDRTVHASYLITTLDRVQPGAAGAPPALHVTYERIQLDTKSGVKALQYDTAAGTVPADPSIRPLCESLARVVGKPLVFALDEQGRVTQVEIPPEIPNEVITGSPFITNPLAGLPGLLPERPVKTGDTWTVASPFDLPVPKGKAPLTLMVVNVLKAFEGAGENRCAVIASQIAIEPRAAAAGAPRTAPWSVGGSGQLTSRFSLARGVVTKTEGTIAMVITPVPESSAPGLRKIMTRQEITITLLPAPAK
jgi:hypothetical protein